MAGLALAGASAAGLSYLITQSRKVQTQVEDALVEGIGADYVDQLDTQPTPADLATPWRKLVNPFRMRNTDVRVEKNIAYNDHGRRGLLDVYLPAAGVPAGGAPVLLQVHGGGWTIGNKDQQGIPLMQHMAAKGWVCVAINYRLAPRDPFPAHVIDVKQAIAWIKDNIAAYGGDPDYVAITGGSAGGHLTALAALTPARQGVAAGLRGRRHLRAGGGAPLRRLRLRRLDRPEERPEDARPLPRPARPADQLERSTPSSSRPASPILRITPDAPDFFVLHGIHDSLVEVEQARLFVEKLREISKRTVIYAELTGAQHAFDVFPSIRSSHVVRAIDRYLHWHWNQYRHEHAQITG